MKTLTPPQRRRFEKIARTLDYPDAARLLKEMVETGHPDTRAARALAERAWEIAPDDTLAGIFLALYQAFNDGRRVGFSTGGITVEVSEEQE
jgi:hypothetical protein